MMKRWSVLIYTALLMFGLSPIAHASSEERIASFNSQIVLTADANADITETIVYDFGASSRHGIKRDIPTSYQDDQKNHYRVNFLLASVTNAAGQPWPFRQSSSVIGTELKIGDATQLVSGQQTYIIHYSLRPIITPETALDNLRLNITGNGWTAPMDQVSATITSPAGAAPIKSICYTGSAESVGAL